MNHHVSVSSLVCRKFPTRFLELGQRPKAISNDKYNVYTKYTKTINFKKETATRGSLKHEELPFLYPSRKKPDLIFSKKP